MQDVRLLLTSGLYDELIKAAKELLSADDHADKNRKILSDLLLNLEDKSELESRDDDEDWFKGTEFTQETLFNLDAIEKVISFSTN